MLRAECLRRFPRGFGVVHEVTLRELDETKAERDWLKRNLDAANEIINRDVDAEVNLDTGQMRIVRRVCESGPGIEAMPPPRADAEQWGATLEDLLADDA
jgi:hypothetical protein